MAAQIEDARAACEKAQIEKAARACEETWLGLERARCAFEYAQQLYDAALATFQAFQASQPADVGLAPSQDNLPAAAAAAKPVSPAATADANSGKKSGKKPTPLQRRFQLRPPQKPQPTPPPPPPQEPQPTMLPLDHFSRLEQMEGCYFATMTKESAKEFIKPVPEDRLWFVVYPNLDKQKEKGYKCQVFRATYRNYRDELTHMDFCRSPVNLGLCHDDRFDLADCYPTVTAFLDSRLQKRGLDYGKLLRPWPSHPGHILSVPGPGAKPPGVGVQPATYKRSSTKATVITSAAAESPSSTKRDPTAHCWVPASSIGIQNKCVKSLQPVDP